jgi:hypothetical protein
MLILLIVSWAIGWLLNGRDKIVRRTMTLTTSLRNVGVGLVIATGSFAGTPAATAVLVYACLRFLDRCCWPCGGGGSASQPPSGTAAADSLSQNGQSSIDL